MGYSDKRDSNEVSILDFYYSKEQWMDILANRDSGSKNINFMKVYFHCKNKLTNEIIIAVRSRIFNRKYIKILVLHLILYDEYLNS